ncbi:g9910 [Coccomyxa viridis]|uniref:G9910 protein n=1 Tax=Coccomyxa viridis TaxID=1274662 RepID=A0ABP1G5G1_9CHLO
MPSNELAFQNVGELRPRAEKILPKQAFGYYVSGSESESTLRDNEESFKRYRLVPRLMVDVSKVDTTVKLLGKEIAFPLLVAPMAMQRMAHPDGELATSRAAAAEGIPMVQSTMGTVELAEVREAGAAGPLMMFQLYVFKERDFVKQLIQHAERSGYDAIVVTVDAPFLGKREADERYGFKLPEHLRLENLTGLAEAARMERKVHSEEKGSGIALHFADHIDSSLTWDFLPWLHTVTSLPIFLKGVLSPEDAHMGVQAGADGIIVSNHGGRQLDFAPAALDALPGIAAAVGKRVPVLMDGGVRRGTDIIKALAMGADAVLIGRPILWGLALAGEEGVRKVLETIRKELRLSMALMGCPSIRHLHRSMVIAPWDQYPNARL